MLVYDASETFDEEHYSVECVNVECGAHKIMAEQLNDSLTLKS
jgi:hypothetical protein